jgi:hypothetical protein
VLILLQILIKISKDFLCDCCDQFLAFDTCLWNVITYWNLLPKYMCSCFVNLCTFCYVSCESCDVILFLNFGAQVWPWPCNLWKWVYLLNVVCICCLDIVFFVNFMLVNNVKLSCEIRCIKNLQPLWSLV